MLSLRDKPLGRKLTPFLFFKMKNRGQNLILTASAGSGIIWPDISGFVLFRYSITTALLGAGKYGF